MSFFQKLSFKNVIYFLLLIINISFNHGVYSRYLSISRQMYSLRVSIPFEVRTLAINSKHTILSPVCNIKLNTTQSKLLGIIFAAGNNS